MRFLTGVLLGVTAAGWWYERSKRDDEDDEDETFPFIGSNTEDECEIRWHRGAGNEVNVT